MKIRLLVLQILLLFFLLGIVLALPPQYDSRDYPTYEDYKSAGGSASGIPPSEIDKNPKLLEEIGEAGDIGKLTPTQIGNNINNIPDKYKNQLTAQQLSSKAPDGSYNIDKIGVGNLNKLSKEARGDALKILGRTPNVDTETDEKPSTVTTNPSGFYIDYIHSINIDGIRVINAYGIDYENNVLSVGKADTIIIKDGLLSDVTGFKGNVVEFKVKEVKNVVNKCVSMNNVKDSRFKVSDDIIEVNSDKDVSYNITDCSLTQSNFNSLSNNSEVKISKTPLPHYEIKEGELRCYGESTSDKIEANNQASVDYGIDCFTCITINPPGTYFYLDSDVRKDFNINVPKESSTYKLCLRKNQAQQFKDYNGLADFVEKRIELNGVVNYLRYPFKNNQISSLLSNFVYKGLKDVDVIFSYDNNLVFLNNIFLSNKNNIKTGTLSITYPSNYYTIKEMEVGGDIHSIVHLNLNLKKQDLTQNINYGYRTNYFEPKVSINNNVLFQDNGKNKLVILPPEHEKIKELLENAKK
ncbi:MAG: hypothetical protein Q8R04_00170 [Nanoarchaeota archaeon]|nr:hypothetical protein [Nanoarchaeota archaeon]